MKKTPILLAMGLAGILVLSRGDAWADLEVSAAVSIHATADFDAPLSSCGTWVNVGSYGRCWRPVGIAAGWQPYCNGEWVWTDCGWYWESDEPWAWACYHYGYWVYDPTYGWVWIPGVDWAPAWVCWRIGDGCIGWAPMCPPGFFFNRRPIDAAFVFVDNDRFGSHIGPSVIVTGNRHDLIRRTKFISNVGFASRDVDGHGARRVAINEGPGLDAIQKATGRPFKAVSMNTALRRTPVPMRFNSPHNSWNNPAQSARPELRITPNPDEHAPSFSPNQHPGNNSPPPPPVKSKYNQAPDKHYSGQGSQPNEATPDAAPGWNQGNDRGQGGGQDGGHGHGHDRGNN